MWYRIMAVIMALAASLLAVEPLFANDVADLKIEVAALRAKVAEMDALRAQVTALEARFKDYECAITTQGTTVKEIKESLIQYRPGEGLTVPPCGIEITAGATVVLQGTPNANNAGNKEASRFDAAWSSDIFIQKAFDDWGLALLHLEPGQGNGAEDELNLYSNVNRDQNNTNANVPVTELWYEHYLFNKQVVLTAGKMDTANYVDQNQYAHDETSQFIGRIFRQNPAIEWPNDNTLGARVLLAPEIFPYLSLESTYFDANNDWEDVFDRPFISTQLNFEPFRIFGLSPEHWSGVYRVYGWVDGRNHAKLVGAGDQPGNDVKNDNYGFGLSADQAITDVFGAFARFGFQRPDVALASTNANSAPVEASWSGGLQMTGKYWNRSDDVLACGIGQLFPSKHYKDAGNGGAAEGHFEAYYKWQALKWLALSPDLQVIWNPRGVNTSLLGDKDTIFVYGMRGQLDF